MDIRQQYLKESDGARERHAATLQQTPIPARTLHGCPIVPPHPPTRLRSQYPHPLLTPFPPLPRHTHLSLSGTRWLCRSKMGVVVGIGGWGGVKKRGGSITEGVGGVCDLRAQSGRTSSHPLLSLHTPPPPKQKTRTHTPATGVVTPVHNHTVMLWDGVPPPLCVGVDASP